MKLETDKSFYFNPFSMIFPKLCKQKALSEALHHIYEYVDLKNIISRLQDIDKLKLVLFNDKQRDMFEMLPKPGIIGNSNMLPSLLTIQEISKQNKKTQSMLTQEHFNDILLTDDNFSRRILNYSNSNMKIELEQRIAGFLSLIKLYIYYFL